MKCIIVIATTSPHNGCRALGVGVGVRGWGPRWCRGRGRGLKSYGVSVVVEVASFVSVHGVPIGGRVGCRFGAGVELRIGCKLRLKLIHL